MSRYIKRSATDVHKENASYDHRIKSFIRTGGGLSTYLEDSSWVRVQDKGMISAGPPLEDLENYARSEVCKERAGKRYRYFARGAVKNSISYNLRLIAIPH